MKLKDTFLPPGVQAALFARLGTYPRQLPIADAAKIEALWLKRNNCPEDEIETIDMEMEEIAAGAGPEAISASRAINAKRNRIQSSIDRRDERNA